MTSPATRARLHSAGWVLLPLRAFLGATFVFAGLQKLADKHFFDSRSPSSVQSQIHAYARRSPIRGLLLASGHHGVVVGLAIALGELAVGAGALAGLWTRVAAAGGMALSLFFLLAVSWHSNPYYYGPDIVFFFAWTPLLAAGAEVWSLDALLRRRARRELRLAPAGPVSVDFGTVRSLCGSFDRGRCRRLGGSRCDPGPCPVLAAAPALKPAVAANLDRRTFLRQAAAAGQLGAAAVALGGLTAVIGRLVPSKARPATAVLTPGSTLPPDTGSTVTTTTAGPAAGAPNTGVPATTAPPPPATTAPPAPATSALGTAIGPATSVPVGQAASFTVPSSGDPGFVVHPTASRYLAFSAICTHQGCPVDFNQGSGGQAATFVCPCHGAQFDATTGAVLLGPARDPLPAITVALGPDGQLYVKA